jgi:DNA-binding response OmpR family regulator
MLVAIAVTDVGEERKVLAWAKRAGARVARCRSWPDLLVKARTSTIDMAVMDLALVAGRVADVGHALREEHLPQTMLVIGEGTSAADCLQLPITDFVSRPVQPAELRARADRCLGAARTRALPSVNPQPATKVSGGVLEVDLGARTVSVQGESVALRRAEFDLLCYLMRNQQRVVHAAEIVEQVLQSHGDGAAARNQVFELRRKLRASDAAECIVSKRGCGYQFVEPTSR